MPRYKIKQIVETVNEWEVDSEDYEEAEDLALTTPPHKTFTEQSQFDIDEMPEPEREQYWTAMGTFTITRNGTEKAAREAIEQALGDVLDEFEIQNFD